MNRAWRHLRVIGIGALFGLGAYAVVLLMLALQRLLTQ